MPILKGERPGKALLRNGILIEAPEDETLIEMIDEIFRKKVYNPSDLPIEPDDIVVDIGANVGVFMIYAALKTKNTVLAFEPSPRHIEFLRKNTETNGLHNVVIHNLAVSDRSGIGEFVLAKTSGGHLLSDRNSGSKLYDHSEVPITTLERIIIDNSLERIDFMKLDCEGVEGQILQSTPEEQLRKIRKIAVEFHDNVSSLRHDEIAELLGRLGFSCWLDWDSVSSFGYLYGKMN